LNESEEKSLPVDDGGERQTLAMQVVAGGDAGGTGVEVEGTLVFLRWMGYPRAPWTCASCGIFMRSPAPASSDAPRVR